MKSVVAVLGLALLMGCANSDNSDDCQSCGKRLTEAASSPEVQEVACSEENVTPSN